MLLMEFSLYELTDWRTILFIYALQLCPSFASLLLGNVKCILGYFIISIAHNFSQDELSIKVVEARTNLQILTGLVRCGF